MKKKYIILLLSLMVYPCFVDAKVDQNTPTSIYYLKDESDAKNKCLEAVKNNDSSVLTKGTAGYYLECIEVSCSNNKNITINKKLISYSESAIRYVILHELCHLKYMNHSKDFWDLVKKYMPEYRKAKAELK